MKFTFSLPCWNSWHTWLYLRDGLKSHAKAGLEGKYIVHTDRPDILEPYVQPMLPKCEVEFRKVSPINSYFQFSEYQQECFNESEVCMFLQPDTVMKDTTFHAVRREVEAGHKLVMTAGINTIDDGTILPTGEDLPQWAVDHLIPELRGNIFAPGHEMMCPLTMYFRDGENFWCHAFYHHPLCVVNDRRMEFKHTTIDWLVPSYFVPHETKVLSGHEGLMVETSPPPKFSQHPRSVIYNATDMALKVQDKIMTAHLNLWAQAIPIVGQPTQKYEKLVNDVLKILESKLFADKRLVA